MLRSVFLTRYQWLVLLAAWLGWGFDVFDALLFNYVAPNCIPVLLGLPIGSAEAKAATLYWTGILTALLLIGWAAGGVLFGLACDRLGRLRTMMLTMLLYSLGTAACAFAPNIELFVFFRLLASLGIGGEWAAGAAMVAEVVPEKRRVEAGALLYTASPLGLFLAAFVNYQIAGVWMADSPETSWRYVFLCGLFPAALAFVLRYLLHEPERWREQRAQQTPVKLSELFSASVRPLTICGTVMALLALITWWSCNAFLPTVASSIAQERGVALGLNGAVLTEFIEQTKFRTTVAFNLGGLAGTLLAIPIAKVLGRRAMFAGYFAFSAAAILLVFGLNLDLSWGAAAYFLVGLSVYGLAGTFTFYLPELFPTRLRGTGSGFCYNVGRVIAAPGPFIVGALAARGDANEAIFYVGFLPLLGLLALPLVIETKGRALS